MDLGVDVLDVEIHSINVGQGGREHLIVRVAAALEHHMDAALVTALGDVVQQDFAMSASQERCRILL